MSIDMGAIASKINSGLKTHSDNLTDMLDNLDLSSPEAMLKINMESQKYFIGLNLESTLQKDIKDAINSIIQKN